jgi:DNA primase
MAISPRFKDELRTRLTLSDVVGRKVRLTRAGREFKGCCPFHNEKTASFYVNDDKQFYHCFGCGAHGDAIGFVMEQENKSFIEAIESLAAEVNMEVPKASPQEVAKAKQEKSLYTLMEDATRWMEGQLRDPANKGAYRYILERGMSEEQLNNFRVGFAPADRGAVRKAMQALGYTDAQMIEVGILRAGKQGREPYAFFRERIMFPVPDRRGRVVAFGGRILPDHLLEPTRGDYIPAKYMNSSDTTLFHKGGMLYGEPRARQAAVDGQDILVVEGYVDVVACVKAGYGGAMAPMGTALTEDQILVLWKMIPDGRKVPILCFDGDNAGRRAAARAVERILPLLKPDHSARFAFLPDGQDPDSLVNAQGKQALQAVIEAAIPLVDFLWMYHTTGQKFDTPEARAGLSKTLENEALQISDREVQHYYRQAFREKVNKAFGQNYQKNYQKSYGAGRQSKFTPYNKKPANEAVATMKRPAFSRQRLLEQVLLGCVINHPAVFERIEEDLGRLVMGEPRLDLLRQAVLSQLSENSQETREGLLEHLSTLGFDSEMRGVLCEAVYTHAAFIRPQTDFDDVLAGWEQAISVFYQQGKQGNFR